MKRLLNFLVVISLFFVSCNVEPVDNGLLETSNNNSQNPNNPITPTPTTPVLVTKIIETLSNGDIETTNFTYNGTKISKMTTITSNSIEETNYVYTNDLITKSTYFLNGVLTETTNFEYNTDLKLIKCTYIQGTTVEITDYVYNANSTVSFITQSGTDVLATGTVYLSNNQAYKKTVVFDPGTSNEYTETQETSFDSKINPFINVTGFSKLDLETPSEIVGFSGVFNNPIMLKRDNVTDDTSTYTYNANNMPLLEVYTDLVNPNWSATYQYFYNQ